MIIDKQLMMSDGQLITGSAASESYIDTGAKGNALDGSELYLVVRVKVELDSAGEAATLTIALQSDSDPAFGTVVTHFSTAALLEAALVAGYVALKMKLPVGLGRYIRLYYTYGTEVFTGGSVDAFLTPNVDVAL